VQGDDPVKQGVGKRQGAVEDKTAGVGAAGRPDLDALRGRHGGYNPSRARLGEQRRRIAKAEHVQARNVAPRLADLAGDQARDRLPKGACVEPSQLEDVLAHRRSRSTPLSCR
jgi:hypothetical protein